MIDIVCFSINNWEKRRARKQQFMLHLALRDDVGRVLFVEPPLNFWRLIFLPWIELKLRENRIRWKRALFLKSEPSGDAEKLFIYTPIFIVPFAYRCHFIYKINLCIASALIRMKIKRQGFGDVALWMYHPFDYPLLHLFRERVVSVFDWAENWPEYFSEFSAKRKEQVRFLEEKIIRDADIVFVVSGFLLKRALKINKNVFQVLDGTVPQIFQDITLMPQALIHVPHPIIGYAGTISQRFDVPLVIDLSRKFRQCSIVLVGDILLPQEKVMNLLKEKNIFLLGGVGYSQVPAYIKNFDVCIVPYHSDQNMSPPTKIYDYLASGKPIVSIYIQEISSMKDVINFAHSKEEFNELVGSSLSPQDTELRERRIKMAVDNSWGSRAQQIMEIISAHQRNG